MTDFERAMMRHYEGHRAWHEELCGRPDSWRNVRAAQEPAPAMTLSERLMIHVRSAFGVAVPLGFWCLVILALGAVT